MKNNFKKLNIAIIGAGKVGSSFAFELNARGFKIKYLIDENIKNLKKICSALKIKFYDTYVDRNIIQDSQIIIIAVQDSRIPALLKNFRGIDLRNKFIFHTSGYFHSKMFKKLKVNRRFIGSFHPLQTFSNVSFSNQFLLRNIYFGIEGGTQLRELLIYLSKNLKSKYIIIKTDDKSLYHFACVFASNFLVSYLNILNGILKSTSIKPVKDIKIFYPIIERTISNIKDNGLAESLTGPFARADLEVIKGHTRSLRKELNHLIPIYKLFGREAIILAKNKNLKVSKDLKILSKFVNDLK